LIQSDILSVRVFIDLLDLQSALPAAAAPDSEGGAAEIDWRTFPWWLGTEAIRQAPAFAQAPLEFLGAHIYVALDPGDPRRTASLRGWVREHLDGPPDVHVVLQEITQGPGECYACEPASTPNCHRCRNMTAGGVANVVDAMATDLFRLTREDAFDVVLLVASDLALIPVVRFLEGRGKRVVHGAFPPRARDLSAACSAVVDLGALLGSNHPEPGPPGA
jgi:hypothetical protein